MVLIRRHPVASFLKAAAAATAFTLVLPACTDGTAMQVDGISLLPEAKPAEQVAKMEQTLAAMGFQAHYAGTPKVFAAIKKLPQHTLGFEEFQNRYRYVYADIEVCGCVYIGDRAAYQRYQAMLMQEGISDLQSEAEMMNAPLSADWTGWGPWYDPTY